MSSIADFVTKYINYTILSLIKTNSPYFLFIYDLSIKTKLETNKVRRGGEGIAMISNDRNVKKISPCKKIYDSDFEKYLITFW